jgi:hypothetical protein
LWWDSISRRAWLSLVCSFRVPPLAFSCLFVPMRDKIFSFVNFYFGIIFELQGNFKNCLKNFTWLHFYLTFALFILSSTCMYYLLFHLRSEWDYFGCSLFLSLRLKSCTMALHISMFITEGKWYSVIITVYFTNCRKLHNWCCEAKVFLGHTFPLRSWATQAHSNEASWSQAETCQTVSQTKPFLILSWLAPVFVTVM